MQFPDRRLSPCRHIVLDRPTYRVRATVSQGGGARQRVRHHEAHPMHVERSWLHAAVLWVEQRHGQLSGQLLRARAPPVLRSNPSNREAPGMASVVRPERNELAASRRRGRPDTGCCQSPGPCGGAWTISRARQAHRLIPGAAVGFVAHKSTAPRVHLHMSLAPASTSSPLWNRRMRRVRT